MLGEVRGNLALAAFFDAGRVDPFVVTDLPNVAGLRREAIILSVGLGRTPHQRVLHSFGPISAPGGDALLLDALGSTRHRLTVVSCFGADDLDAERLRGAGPQLLADLLAFAARRGAGSDVADLVHAAVRRPAAPVRWPRATAAADQALAAAPEPDRLLLDIAERLWKHGLLVEADHGIPGGERIPLVVGHPDLPDEMLVAVLTDDADVHRRAQRPRARPAHRRPPRARRVERRPRLVRGRVHRPAGRGRPHPPRRPRPRARARRPAQRARCTSG